MGLKLEQLIDRCMGVATEKGLSRANPITLKISEPVADTNTLIVVSYDEPHELILPLNVTWIDADPASDDHKVAFKRSSKTSSGGFNNTWVDIQTYAEVFTPPQYYSSEDSPVPIYNEESEVGSQLADKISRSGDSMEGPLKSRQLLATESNFSLDEMIPRSFLVTEMSRQTQGFYSLLSQFNSRIARLQNSSFTQGQTLVEIQDSLDSGNGGGGGGTALIRHVHTQDVPSSSWTVEHDLSNPNILYTIRSQDGNTVMPQAQKAIQGTGDNMSVITFAEPILGTAILVSL